MIDNEPLKSNARVEIVVHPRVERRAVRKPRQRISQSLGGRAARWSVPSRSRSRSMRA